MYLDVNIWIKFLVPVRREANRANLQNQDKVEYTIFWNHKSVPLLDNPSPKSDGKMYYTEHAHPTYAFFES